MNDISTAYSDKSKCPTCKGSQIVNSGHHEYEAAPCPDCAGTGQVQQPPPDTQDDAVPLILVAVLAGVAIYYINNKREG